MAQEAEAAATGRKVVSWTPGRARFGSVRAALGALPILLVVALLAGGLLVLYAAGLDDLLVADDLGLVRGQVDSPFVRVFDVKREWQHYVPIQQFVLWVQANTSGTDPFAYHAVALLLGWVIAVLVVVVARRLGGRIEVAALAGLLFVAFGTNWEPYLRAAAGSAYTAATALSLAGFSLYVRSHDGRLGRDQRRLAYGGFLVALILSPLAYGLGITLIGACALYRLFVLERGAGYGAAALALRARDWLRDFALPALLVLAWFGFKVSLGLGEQAPGLSASGGRLVESLSLGLAQSLVPGWARTSSPTSGTGPTRWPCCSPSWS